MFGIVGWILEGSCQQDIDVYKRGQEQKPKSLLSAILFTLWRCPRNTTFCCGCCWLETQVSAKHAWFADMHRMSSTTTTSPRSVGYLLHIAFRTIWIIIVNVRFETIASSRYVELREIRLWNETRNMQLHFCKGREQSEGNARSACF
jgi:hypothetical protein